MQFHGRTLLRNTLVGHVFAGHSSATLLHVTLVGHSCRTLLHFVRDFFQNSLVKSPKRAFCTGLPQKLTLEVCKTSISSETSAKIHALSLQNERFVRDPLQKSDVKVSKTSISDFYSHVSKSPKRLLRTRFPPKVKRKAPTGTAIRPIEPPITPMPGAAIPAMGAAVGTAIGAWPVPALPEAFSSPAKQFRDPSPSSHTCSHTPLPMSQRHSPPPQLAASRLPAPAMKICASTPSTSTAS